MTSVRPIVSHSSKQVGLVAPCVGYAGIVKYLTHLDSTTPQVFARSINIRDDQVQSLRGPRSRRSYILSENDRASRARWRELQNPKILAVVEVRIEPPAKLCVELLRALNIRNGNYHDLELHIEFWGAGVARRFVITDF